MFWTYFLVAMIFNLVIGAWLAVGWHRFVLLEEYPNGWLPAWHGSNIIGCVFRVILLGLIYIGLAISLGLVAGMLGVALANILGVIGVFIPMVSVIVVILWVLMRLSLVLPAIAIGEAMRFGEAWEKTKPVQLHILGSMLIIALIYYVPSLIMSVLSLNLGLELLIQMIIGFFATLISVSYFTTLYGVVVEERELD